MILYLKTANQKVLAGNTYWPTKPGTAKAVDNDLPPAAVNNSLWNKYAKWLSNLKERQDLSPTFVSALRPGLTNTCRKGILPS